MNTFFQVISLTWTLSGGQFVNEATLDAGAFSTADPFFVETGFEFQIPLSWEKGDENIVFIGTQTQNQFFPSGSVLTLAPWQDTFTFNLGMRVWGVEAGYQHQCIHPVKTSGKKDSDYFSGYDKLYLKIEGKL